MDPQTIAIWKIVVDIGLMATLIAVAAKFLRSPARDITRLAELDASIRLLLKEAEAGSKGLAEQLMRRQESLERLLMDIGGSEQRISRAISQADELKGSLSALIQASHSIPATHNRSANENTIEKQQVYQKEVAPPEPPSFAEALVAQPQISRNRVEQVRRTKIESNQRLASQVEKELAPSEKTIPEIKQVYQAAEKMLKAGEDLKTVSSITRLSVEQLSRLRDSLIEEQEPVHQNNIQENESAQDSRLGALGPVRRQTQIL